MYFIRSGLVELFNHESDELEKEKPFLYLPKFSFFGDYQILYKLKSNIIFRTLSEFPENQKNALTKNVECNFMCIKQEELISLCELFPQTADNIKKRSLERRYRFMQQRKSNLNKQAKQRLLLDKNFQDDESEMASSNQNWMNSMEKGERPTETQLMHFYSDEEPETMDQEKEDIKQYLGSLNKRIDGIVEALKQADEYSNTIRQEESQITGDKKGKKIERPEQKKSMAEVFKESLTRSKS